MRKHLASIVIALFGIVAGAGIVYASIPGPDGVIHACRDNKSGALTVIDSAATCPKGTTALNWNQVGPAGATGAQGPAGPAGARGPQGLPGGVSGYVIVSNIGFGQALATCPPGTKVLGGGGQTGGAATALAVSAPSGDSGWIVYQQTNVPPVQLSVWAICANVT